MNGVPEKKKSGNAFTRVMKAIFVSDFRFKLLAAIIGGFIWIVTVGLGVADSNNTATLDEHFFRTFWSNIIEEFTTETGGLSVGSIIVSAVDIFLLICLVYFIIYFLKKNNALPIIKFFVLITFVGIVLTSALFDFPVMGSLFSYGVLLVFIAVLIMFPQELRRTMWKLASKTGSETFNVEYDCTEEELRKAVSEIVKAVLNMSKDNVGALIVITTQSVPQHILDSGTDLNAKLSQPLIECLFNTGADLHDGAVFIHGDKILAAGCFLPLSQNQNLPKELGTRHRAALGLSEQYDVITIVVSEETGVISVARDGKLERYYDASMLTDVIEQTYGLKATQSDGKKKRFRLRMKQDNGNEGDHDA